MFKSFFWSKQWALWAWGGAILILTTTWYSVTLLGDINAWERRFWDTIELLFKGEINITQSQYYALIGEAVYIAALYVAIVVVLEFFISHFVFRWRTAMNNYYMSQWPLVRGIEGAAQRVQEDTMRFARIVEGLGVAFFRSLMMLAVFLPILLQASAKVSELPVFGEVTGSMVYVAVGSALFGTVLLMLAGIKLPGLEFNNQKVEAAYRKELVYGEDYADRAGPPKVKELFTNVRRNYFRLYFHYMYFNVFRWSYLQFSVFIPFIALGPTLLSGAAAGVVTLGFFRQTIAAFERVESSFQFLVHSWPTIIELLSIHKRLKGFEREIRKAQAAQGS